MLDAMGYLYQLTFSSGKHYIGLTKKSVCERFSVHRRAASRNSAKRAAVYRAWLKYGEPECRTLCEAPDDHLAEIEQLLIGMCGTMVPSGYNMTAGGEGTLGFPGHWAGKKRPPFSDEWKAKLSARLIGNQYAKGMRHTPENIEKMRMWGNQFAKGMKVSEAHKAKLAEFHRGNQYGKPKTMWHRARISVGQAMRRARARGAEFSLLDRTGRAAHV